MKGVVFDFGNVLYRVDYHAMASRLAPARADELLTAFVGRPFQVSYESGRIGLDEVLANLGQAGFAFERAQFLDAYLSIFSPVDGLSALLGSVAARYPLGILSNTTPEHAGLFIERTPEYRLFQTSLYSFEMGCMKPDPRLYREIARRMGIDCRHLAYVDDVEAFARAADGVGMVGIPFSTADNLGSRLRELDFRF